MLTININIIVNIPIFILEYNIETKLCWCLAINQVPWDSNNHNI